MTDHECEVNISRLPDDLHGPAVTEIYFWSQNWWATNGEYATPISYCPFCGEKLPKPQELTDQ